MEMITKPAGRRLKVRRVVETVLDGRHMKLLIHVTLLVRSPWDTSQVEMMVDLARPDRPEISIRPQPDDCDLLDHGVHPIDSLMPITDTVVDDLDALGEALAAPDPDKLPDQVQDLLDQKFNTNDHLDLYGSSGLNGFGPLH